MVIANSGMAIANSGMVIANSGIVIANSGIAIENFYWMSIIILQMALHTLSTVTGPTRIHLLADINIE